jgi:hypothetical protein
MERCRNFRRPLSMMRLYLMLLIYVVSFPVNAFAAYLGPYSGTVLDSQTGKTVEGATVFMYWVKSVPETYTAKGLPIIVHWRSEKIDLRLVYTDRQGTYKIPRFMANTGLTERLESTSVIIYQPGYQAYIKEISHNSPYVKPDLEFKEKENVVKLERIPPNFDHHKHYEEIDQALRGIDEYRNDTSRPDDAGIDEVEWKKMVAFDKKVVPYKQELLQRVKWEERRGMER